MRSITESDYEKLGSVITNGLGLVYYEDYLNLGIPIESNWVEIARILLEREEVLQILQDVCTKATQRTNGNRRTI